MYTYMAPVTMYAMYTVFIRCSVECYALLHCCPVSLLFAVALLVLPYAIQPSFGCNKRFSILFYCIV